MGHPSWECSRPNSLNFRVPMEPEANELPKGLVLGRDGNIHIRLIGSTPLGDVGCYITFMTNSQALTSSSSHPMRPMFYVNHHIPRWANPFPIRQLRRNPF
ncbi:hypothetical protein ACFX13_003522 [Malus domestica]